MKAFTRNIALQVVANERLGFEFGKPERVDEHLLSVVLPILRKTAVTRQYILLPETKEVRISDTGNINRMRFANNAKENVFVRSGTMLKGGTQERATTRSAVLFPGKEVELDVRCVHASRPITAGAITTYAGSTPLNVERSSYDEGFRPRSQAVYWANVSKSAQAMGHSTRTLYASGGLRASLGMSRTMGGTIDDLSAGGVITPDSVRYTERQDDLHSNVGAFSKTFEELLRKVKLHEHQVGLGFITDKGVETVELFDVPLSWKALHEDTVKRLGPDIANFDKTSVFEYKPEKAVAAVKEVLGTGYQQNTIFEHKPSNGEPWVMITGLTSERFVGEVVEVDERVVHLVLFRREN